MIAPALVAILCVVGSLAVDTDQWAAWFSHPLRDPMPPVTRAGAGLWRLMLLICAAALTIIPPSLGRLSPGTHIVTTSGASNALGSRELWALCGVLVAAVAIRAVRITESLWYDEIAAWFLFGEHGPGPIMGNYIDPANHIAHTLVTFFSVGLLQDAFGFETALRLPAFLASLATIPAVAGLARVTLGPRPAVVAAGLAAVAPVWVLEAVEARGYSMMILFSAVATWLFVTSKIRDHGWEWCLYSVVCAVGIWVHFVAVFVPIGHAVWLGWRALRYGEIGRAARGGLAIALAGVIAATLYAPVLGEILTRHEVFAATRGDEPALFGAEGWHALLQLGGSWYAWAAWPGLGVLIVGAARLLRRHGKPEAPLFVDAAPAGLMGLPIFLLVVLAAGSWMYARFALFCLPAAALLVAAGLQSLWRWKRPAAIAAGVLLLALALGDLAVRPPKQPLRDASGFVRANRASGEGILVIGLAYRVIDIYLADLDPDYSLGHGADLRRALAGSDPSWIVLYYPNHVSPQRYALLRESGFHRAKRFRGWVDWTNGDVEVWKKDG